MSATEVDGSAADAAVKDVDLKLEVVVIPVSDVHRAKAFMRPAVSRSFKTQRPPRSPRCRVLRSTPSRRRACYHSRASSSRFAH